MTPIKQTVYLPVNKNNEFTVVSVLNYYTEASVNRQEGYLFTPEQLNEYTANVIKQALEAAAEKAKTEYIEPDGCATGDYYDVDKQSITNTFEETYQKFKV